MPTVSAICVLSAEIGLVRTDYAQLDRFGDTRKSSGVVGGYRSDSMVHRTHPANPLRAILPMASSRPAKSVRQQSRLRRLERQVALLKVEIKVSKKTIHLFLHRKRRPLDS
jgi:hypothetical protein